MWIDLKETKPKNYQSVIISVKTFYDVSYSMFANYNDGKFVETTTNDPFLNINQKEITHWQSLPLPFKQ